MFAHRLDNSCKVSAVVAHMCYHIAVMNNGLIVEEVIVETLRDGQVTHPYTRQLLTASRGYDRSRIDACEDFRCNNSDLI